MILKNGEIAIEEAAVAHDWDRPFFEVSKGIFDNDSTLQRMNLVLWIWSKINKMREQAKACRWRSAEAEASCWATVWNR